MLGGPKEECYSPNYKIIQGFYFEKVENFGLFPSLAVMHYFVLVLDKIQ